MNIYILLELDHSDYLEIDIPINVIEVFANRKSAIKFKDKLIKKDAERDFLILRKKLND